VGPCLFLAERAGRLRALRGGIRRAGLASPARPNRQFAVRKADGVARRGRALQSGKPRSSLSIAFTTQFQFEGRRSSVFESLTAARRAAPRAAGARCKARSHATACTPQSGPSPDRYEHHRSPTNHSIFIRRFRGFATNFCTLILIMSSALPARYLIFLPCVLIHNNYPGEIHENQNHVVRAVARTVPRGLGGLYRRFVCAGGGPLPCP